MKKIILITFILTFSFCSIKKNEVVHKITLELVQENDKLCIIAKNNSSSKVCFPFMQDMTKLKNLGNKNKIFYFTPKLVYFINNEIYEPIISKSCTYQELENFDYNEDLKKAERFFVQSLNKDDFIFLDSYEEKKVYLNKYFYYNFNNEFCDELFYKIPKNSDYEAFLQVEVNGQEVNKYLNSEILNFINQNKFEMNKEIIISNKVKILSN